LLIGGIQTAAFLLAVFLWRRSPGAWNTAAWATYFVGLLLVAPILAWISAAAVLRHSWKTPWHVWPVCLAMILVWLFGHGLEDEFGAWAPSAALAILSVAAGGIAILHQDAGVTGEGDSPGN